MFDKFTESARRSVFFARYEASNFGNEYIETYHLLLGVLRQDGSLKVRLVGKVTIDELRAEFAHLAGSSKISTSADLPLSRACKRAMAFAAEEASRTKNPVIGTEHLLAGLLRERTPASDELEKRGVTLQMVRESFGGPPVQPEARGQASAQDKVRDRPAPTGFENYTELARRTVFFARYEASNFGSETIEPYHWLLAILREDRLLRIRVLDDGTLDELRAEFAHLAGSSKISTSVDLPLDSACKRVMAFAAEEAALAGSRAIGPEHLLACLLHERSPASDALEKRGITLQVLREFSAAPSAEVRAKAALQYVREQDRLAAAIRLLEALASSRVVISVMTPTDQFTISFPPETGA